MGLVFKTRSVSFRELHQLTRPSTMMLGSFTSLCRQPRRRPFSTRWCVLSTHLRVNLTRRRVSPSCSRVACLSSRVILSSACCHRLHRSFVVVSVHPAPTIGACRSCASGWTHSPASFLSHSSPSVCLVLFVLLFCSVLLLLLFFCFVLVFIFLAFMVSRSCNLV